MSNICRWGSPSSSSRWRPGDAAVELWDVLARAEICGQLPDGRISQRPLDVAFFGEGTHRQLLFLVDAARELARRRCYLHLPGKFAPGTPDSLGPIDATTIAGIAQRGNCIARPPRLSSGIRVAEDRARWDLARALVISEPGTQIPPFRPGVDYVEAPLAEIPGRLNHYLGTEAGRREAADITHRAGETLRRQCRLAVVLEVLLARFSAPQPRRAGRRSRSRTVAAR